jgi:hypothetical protein
MENNLNYKYLIKLIESGKHIDWFYISIHRNLPEEFIEKYSDKISDKINWDYVGREQKLSLKFMKKYANKLNWYYISYHQKLPIVFIKEFSDKIYFNYIPLCIFKVDHAQSWKTFL